VKALRPRALVHRGHVEASGWALLGRDSKGSPARRRVLDLWQDGARLYGDEGDALILVLPAPVPCDCVRAPALPLVACDEPWDSWLSSAPLTESELDALGGFTSAVILVRGGEADARELSDLRRLSASEWLDLGDLELVETQTLGRMPAEVELPEPAPIFDARKAFPDVPPADPGMARVLSAMRAAREGRMPEAAALKAVSGPLRWLGALMSLFRQRQERAAPEGYRVARQARRTPTGAPRQSLFDQLREKATQAFLTAGIYNLFRLQHEQYLARMMDMLERGNLLDGLRHAIPLSESKHFGSSFPTFSVLRPRDNLSLGRLFERGGGSLFASGDLFSHLRELYRSVVARLEAQGKIDEAAYVLSELLEQNEEAVAFLEKHGRLKTAAELAEARDLAPGLVVRLWFMAGDRERAVRIAIARGAFEDAVVRMESSRPEEAKDLRHLWAHFLADGGDTAGAVEVLWPVVEARTGLLPWMQDVVRFGGPPAARTFIRMLCLGDDAASAGRAGAVALLADEADDTLLSRKAVSDALWTEFRGNREPPAGVRALARAAMRARYRDAGNGARFPTDESRHLQTLAGSSPLRADLPQVPPGRVADFAAQTDLFDYHLSRTSRGTFTVCDAYELPDGRIVVAMGERGVRVLTRDGRKIAHFDEPAFDLIPSDSGERCILRSSRDKLSRLARLDLRRLRAEYWCDTRLDCWETTYDGSRWLVGTPDGFLAIDAQDDGFRALWKTRDLDGCPYGIGRERGGASLLVCLDKGPDAWGNKTDAPHTWQSWKYELPGLILRLRRNVIVNSDGIYVAQTNAEGEVASLRVVPSEGEATAGEYGNRAYLELGDGFQVLLSDDAAGAKPFLPVMEGRWVAAAVEDSTGVRCELFDLRTRRIRASIVFDGSDWVQPRIRYGRLVLGDQLGRLVIFDLTHGRVERDLRIS
jgi:hypothetical protein